MLAHGFYHFKLKRNAPIACTAFEPKLGLHRTAINHPAIAPPVTPSGIALCDRDQFGGPPEIPAQQTGHRSRAARRNDAHKKIGGFNPTPGMPADVYIKTGERTFFEYMLRPVLDSFSRAFREH